MKWCKHRHYDQHIGLMVSVAEFERMPVGTAFYVATYDGKNNDYSSCFVKVGLNRLAFKSDCHDINDPKNWFDWKFVKDRRFALILEPQGLVKPNA